LFKTLIIRALQKNMIFIEDIESMIFELNNLINTLLGTKFKQKVILSVFFGSTKNYKRQNKWQYIQ